MSFLITLFWVCLATLFFCYIGYGILVMLFIPVRSLFSHKQKNDDVILPVPVTLIVAAFNEAPVLEKKIQNCLEINYPRDLLRIIFITDGSEDDSPDLVRKHPSIVLLHSKERKGKAAAINRAMETVETPVVVFSDANTMLNVESIPRMMDHYRDPRVGGVAGEKKIIRDQTYSAIGEAEGLYWKYESLMKTLDAGFNTVVGAAGELFSIRKNLFRTLPTEVILDDFIISMNVCRQGYRFAYEPGAFATEQPSSSLEEEKKRKVRISAGAYQSIGYLTSCLNFFRHPLLSFQYISRRLLRWIFCPLMLVILLTTNTWIVFSHSAPEFYSWFLLLQSVFYISALVGWMLVRSGTRSGIFTIPFYFLFMNYCLINGFIRFMKRKHTVLWEKSLRQVVE
jgi:poly-beta-1,6-N-acetyl-D-glucosamine synthase